MDAKIGGNTINPNSSSNTDYAPVALKIYLLEAKNGNAKAYVFNQNDAAKEIGSATLGTTGPGYSLNSRNYYVGNAVFKKVWHNSEDMLIRFDGSSLKKITLPTGDYISFRAGQVALYAKAGSKREQLSGIYRMRANENSFNPIFAAAANNLKRMYELDVLPDSLDKIAVAAETRGAKLVIIELDANGSELRRSPESDKEIYAMGFWQ